jgi:hypothetical protein
MQQSPVADDGRPTAIRATILEIEVRVFLHNLLPSVRHTGTVTGGRVGPLPASDRPSFPRLVLR